ncbi:hypothetical protein ACFO3J_02540 [Streptomyces polygonati]|uniref:Septum formation initiator n=1 Tax=Streptomyces polygonati TaxID=1617087 RepID=A0ABV8HJ94_9ACTN
MSGAGGPGGTGGPGGSGTPGAPGGPERPGRTGRPGPGVPAPAGGGRRPGDPRGPHRPSPRSEPPRPEPSPERPARSARSARAERPAPAGTPPAGRDRARWPTLAGGLGRLGPVRGAGVRTPSATAARTPFVVLVVTLLAGGLVSLLLLNSAVNRDSFQLDKLQKETTGYTDEQQQLQQEVDGYSAPGALERKAQQLGMVPGGNPAFLNPDGTIRGATPAPATPDPAGAVPAAPSPAFATTATITAPTPSATPPATPTALIPSP